MCFFSSSIPLLFFYLFILFIFFFTFFIFLLLFYLIEYCLNFWHFFDILHNVRVDTAVNQHATERNLDFDLQYTGNQQSCVQENSIRKVTFCEQAYASGVTGRGQSANPKTSDREISADLPGKERQGKKGKMRKKEGKLNH